MKDTILEGNIRGHLIRLSVPLLIGSLLQQLYNAVDSLIIGRFLGTQAFSAVGIAGTVMNLMIFVLTGFCTGVAALLGQLYGAGNMARFRQEAFVSTVIGGAMTLALSGVFLCSLRPILRLIQSPEALIPDIEAYLNVIIGGMLATYLYNLLSGMLRAIGDTRAATLFLLIAVTANAAVDYLFVGVLHFGIAGAAWATVISQMLSAALCLIFILRSDRDLIFGRGDMRFDGALVRRTLTFGFSSALHQSSLYIGKIFVQGAVNTLGTAGIAGYTATMRIEGFANSFGTSAGQGLSVFIAQNWGAKRKDRVRAGYLQGLLLCAALGAEFSAILYFTARPGMLIFLDAAETDAIAQGAAYMRLVALFYILCFTGNAFVGYFRGVGWVYLPMIVTTLQIAARALLSYLWVGSMGLRAVALATGLGWILLTIIYGTISLWSKRRLYDNFPLDESKVI